MSINIPSNTEVVSLVIHVNRALKYVLVYRTLISRGNIINNFIYIVGTKN